VIHKAEQIRLCIPILGIVIATELSGEPLIYADNPERKATAATDIKQRADAKNFRTMGSSIFPGVTARAYGQQLYLFGSRPENMFTFIDG